MNSIIIFVLFCTMIAFAVVLNNIKKYYNSQLSALNTEIESQEETIKFLTDLVAKVNEDVHNLNDETVEKMNELISTSNAHHYSYEDLSENFVNLHNTIAYDLEKRVLYLENKVNGGANAKVTSTPCN